MRICKQCKLVGIVLLVLMIVIGTALNRDFRKMIEEEER